MSGTPKLLEVALREADIACLKLQDGSRKYWCLMGVNGAAYWITLGDGNRRPITLFGRVPIGLSNKWANTHKGKVEGIMQLDAAGDYATNVWTHHVSRGEVLITLAQDLKEAGLVSGIKPTLAEVIDQILEVIPGPEETQGYVGLRSQITHIRTKSVSANPERLNDLWNELRSNLEGVPRDPTDVDWLKEVFRILREGHDFKDDDQR